MDPSMDIRLLVLWRGSTVMSTNCRAKECPCCRPATNGRSEVMAGHILGKIDIAVENHYLTKTYKNGRVDHFMTFAS
jgi:hypothetical protein